MAARRARRAVPRAGDDAPPGRGLAARVAVDGAVLGRPLAPGHKRGAAHGQLGGRAPVDAQASAAAVFAGAARARLRSTPAHGLGPAPDRLRAPAPARDGVALPRAAGPLAAAAAGQ